MQGKYNTHAGQSDVGTSHIWQQTEATRSNSADIPSPRLSRRDFAAAVAASAILIPCALATPSRAATAEAAKLKLADVTPEIVPSAPLSARSVCNALYRPSIHNLIALDSCMLKVRMRLALNAVEETC